jgi:hypothetical protein
MPAETICQRGKNAAGDSALPWFLGIWAHPAAPPFGRCGRTGLSAPIKTPFAPGTGVWGVAPNAENKNAEAFLFRSYPLRGCGMASMPFHSLEVFCFAKNFQAQNRHGRRFWAAHGIEAEPKTFGFWFAKFMSVNLFTDINFTPGAKGVFGWSG